MLAAGVQLILGLNGVIWVSAESKQKPDQATDSVASEAQPNLVREVSKAERQAIARVANCIRALAKLYFSIHPASILSVYTVCTAFHSSCLQCNMHMLCSGLHCITWLQSYWKPVLVDGSCPVTQPLLETQTVSTQNIAGLEEVTAAAHQDSLNSAMY